MPPRGILGPSLRKVVVHTLGGITAVTAGARKAAPKMDVRCKAVEVEVRVGARRFRIPRKQRVFALRLRVGMAQQTGISHCDLEVRGAESQGEDFAEMRGTGNPLVRHCGGEKGT